MSAQQEQSYGKVESGQIAARLFNVFAEHGVDITAANRETLQDVFTSQKILHYDRREMAVLLGLAGDESSDARAAIVKDNRFGRAFNELLRRQLVSDETKSRFSESNLSILETADVRVGDSNERLEDISDPDFGDVHAVRELIARILDDTGSAAQGMFWNVVVPNNMDVVLKIQREAADVEELEFSRNSLLQYPLIKRELGEQVLPKQVILTMDDGLLATVQEKVDSNRMLSVREQTISDIVSGDAGNEIRQALTDAENLNRLRVFIKGVERLLEQHHLMVDLVGDNLFMSVSATGVLEIKLPDYGCTEYHGGWDEQGEVERSKRVIEQLKTLVG